MALQVMLAAIEGEIRVQFAYDDFDEVRAFTERMKDKRNGLRRGTYRWNPRQNRKTSRRNPGGDDSWYVNASEVDRLEAIAEYLGAEIVLVDAGVQAEKPVLDGKDAFRVMFCKVPTKVLRKFYLALGRAFHPDKAGSDDALRERFNDVMISINEGWTAVQVEREELREYQEGLDE